jgi:hypothetical protein
VTVLKTSTRKVHLPNAPDVVLYVIDVQPWHLCRLVGRGAHFLRDPDISDDPIASVDIVYDGHRLVPRDFELHSRDGALGRVARTREAGVFLVCLDKDNHAVAYIVVEECD